MKIVALVVEVSSLRRLLGGLEVGPQEAISLSLAPPGGGELHYEVIETRQQPRPVGGSRDAARSAGAPGGRTANGSLVSRCGEAAGWRR